MIRSTNPVTQEILWEGTAAGQSSINAAFKRGKKAFDQWSCTSFSERENLVLRFKKNLEDDQDLLALTISRETGKPLWESKEEVKAMIGKISISISAQKTRCSDTISAMPEFHACTRYKPIGVCAVFGPFNFPAHLPNGHIIPALLAGNTIIFKPSELTPLVAEHILQLWEKADPPPGLINLVQGDAKTGSMIARHPKLNALFFTGSRKTGEILAKCFGNCPEKLLALEMGGNNPIVLGDIQDFKAAAYSIIQSAYLSSGQRCTCARRLIIEEKHQEVIEILKDWIPRLLIGSYTDRPEPFMGPVINNLAADHLLEKQNKLIEIGGNSLLAMKRIEPNVPFLSPGLIDMTSASNRLDEEIFGPLLQVIKVKNFEAALEEANHTDYGLSASLLSASENEYRLFFKTIQAGVINWNRQTTGALSSAPFGGVGKSGNFRPSAFYAADYCNYPVASIESETLTLPQTLTPGIHR